MGKKNENKAEVTQEEKDATALETQEQNENEAEVTQEEKDATALETQEQKTTVEELSKEQTAYAKKLLKETGASAIYVVGNLFFQDKKYADGRSAVSGKPVIKVEK